MVDINYGVVMTYKKVKITIFMLLIFALALSIDCDRRICNSNVIRVLDMVPFCDRIHFSLYIRKGMKIEDIVGLYGDPHYIYCLDTTGGLILHDNISDRTYHISENIQEGRYLIQIDGYDAARFPIEHKILVYLGGFDAIAYVYIDLNNIVRKVDIGGS